MMSKAEGNRRRNNKVGIPEDPGSSGCMNAKDGPNLPAVLE
jgi:hypothetical protein